MKDMTKKDAQRIDALGKKIKGLPEAIQNAICWMIANIHTVDQLAAGEKMSDQEVKRFLKMASEKNDILAWVLITYKQMADHTQQE